MTTEMQSDRFSAVQCVRNPKNMKHADVENRIEQAYAKSGNSMGWRFLSCPAEAMNGARVAFVSMNPGGCRPEPERDGFSMPSGKSAYRDESWGSPVGESKLQKQVLSLFERVGEDPEKVLSGHLVPFRSPDWKSLLDQRGSVRFGEELWSKILKDIQPQIVIAMGGEVIASISRILRINELERIPVNWGNITASRGTFAHGKFIGLPHLSRFSIMNRPESQPALGHLFGKPKWIISK